MNDSIPSEAAQRILNDTIAIHKKINATADKVFAAWENPDARSQWGPPSPDEAIAFVENDFRVGGTDVHLCGPRNDLRFRVETRYFEIRRPACLLFSERVTTGESLLSVSLITVEFLQNGTATDLALTVQIASLVGSDMIAGTRGGWQSALANLDHHLAGDETSRSGSVR